MKDGYVFNGIYGIRMLIGFCLFFAEDIQWRPDDGQGFDFDIGIVGIAGDLHSHNAASDVFGQRLQDRGLGIGKPFATDGEGQIQIPGWQVHRAGAAEGKRFTGQIELLEKHAVVFDVRINEHPLEYKIFRIRQLQYVQELCQR